MGVLLIKNLNPISKQFEYHPVNFSEIIKLLKLCKSSENKLYILSNLSTKTYETIKDEEQIASLFSFFDGMIISGMTPYEKPDPRIFSLFCSTFHIEPQTAIFIDDKYENCISAATIGITRTINCEEFNLVQIAQKLIEFDAILNETE
jgi:FMN phosphatase YigB (HAD superfamily)